jgi:hypothetical protein
MAATGKTSIEKQKISALEKVILKKLQRSKKSAWMFDKVMNR